MLPLEIEEYIAKRSPLQDKKLVLRKLEKITATHAYPFSERRRRDGDIITKALRNTRSMKFVVGLFIIVAIQYIIRHGGSISYDSMVYVLIAALIGWSIPRARLAIKAYAALKEEMESKAT